MMVAGENPIGGGGIPGLAGVPQDEATPAIAGEHFQRVAEPLVIERLRSRTEIDDPIDLCRVAGDAVDGPLQRLATSGVWRHSERRHERGVTPQHEPDLV